MKWTKFAVVAVSFTLALPALAHTLNGRWDGFVSYNGYRIPFPLELSQSGDNVSVSFFNGDDRVSSTGGRLSGKTLSVNFDHYATRLNATYKDDVIHGTYGGARSGLHEFEARPHRESPPPSVHAPEIAGVWDLPGESPKGEHAWRLIVRQNGASVSAAVLRVDGDTGALEGKFQNGKFLLHHFDGARASVAEITPQADGSLDVLLDGFKSSAKRFTAVRLDQAKAKGLPEPTNPDGHTRLKNADQSLAFSAPDLDGKPVGNGDARFRGKVVIVNVTGSWCPNCHDEAPFLEDLYRKYHRNGLEIVALDFEEPDQLKDPSRLRAFIRKYGIDYTYLLAGEPSELQAKLPDAENLNSWPTTFFIGRDGKVRAIHSGFAGVASGPFHNELKRETTARIEKLLSENVRASR